MIDARLEVKLTLERMQAAVLQYLHSNIVPELEGKIGEMVADIDVDGVIRSMVRNEYDATLRRIIETHVHTALWKHQDRIAKIVARVIREEAK